MFGGLTYLIEVNHHIPLQPLTTLDIFQGQGEVHPSGVRDIQVVRVILVPLLYSCKHLILICADNMHILGKGKRGRLLEGALLHHFQGHQSNCGDARDIFRLDFNRKL